MEANFFRRPFAAAESNQHSTLVPAPVNNDFGGLILPPGGTQVTTPRPGTMMGRVIADLMQKHQQFPYYSVENSVAAPAVPELIPGTAGDEVVESHTASAEVPAGSQPVPLSNGCLQGHEVIDHSNPLEPPFLKTNKSGRKAKTTSASYEDRLQTFMLNLGSRPEPEFDRICKAIYPVQLMSDAYADQRQRGVAEIETTDFSKILPASGDTSIQYPPLMQKVLTDCRLDIPESAKLLADYERIRHLSRIYRLILLITPDRSQIKQEWIEETLSQHGEKCNKKVVIGQKVTARQELHLTRDELQNLLNKLRDTDTSNRGYALDVLVSALYSCKVKRPTPNADERCHKQGYQEIRPQNSFFVFARAFERCVSQGENIRQTSLRMYTKIVWHKVLTEDQRDLFQAIYNEMKELHLIIHPEYKYAPKCRAPGHQQTPAENGEQSGAVQSSPSASSQISQAEHANADANADSPPAKWQCLATEETAVAAQLVTSMPWEVPDTFAGDSPNGQHYMGYGCAKEESAVALLDDPALVPVYQSYPFDLSQLAQDQPYIPLFSLAPGDSNISNQYAEAAGSNFNAAPVPQMIDAPISSFQDWEPQENNGISVEEFLAETSISITF